MALPSSGAMRMGADIGVELGNTATSMISLGATAPRTLAGVPSGAIRLAADFYGKASAFIFNQTISSNTNDYNLRSAAIAAGWDQVLVLQATVTINAGVFVGSSSTGSAAFQTGSSFPAGSTLAIINNGSIVGRGGNGGSAGFVGGDSLGSAGGGGGGVVNGSAGTRGTFVPPSNSGSAGTNTAGGSGGARGTLNVSSPAGGSSDFSGSSGSSGGLALSVGYATSITNNGTIGGGGGGGGGGSGTLRFNPSIQRIFVTAGAGGNGGSLGSAGSAGETIVAGANGGSGGAAGAAVNGNSNITWLATGTRLGAIS